MQPRSMHIALIHYRLVNFGGLETRLKSYAACLSEMGHRVTIICARTDGHVALPENAEYVKLNPGLITRPYRHAAFNRKLGRYMQHHSFDISLSLGRTSHQDIVLCPGNQLGYMQAMGRQRPGWKDRVHIRADREAFASSRIILAASRMIKQELIRHYRVPEEKIDMLHPPLNLQSYPPVQPGEKEEARRRLGLHAGKQYFLFVSLGHQRKGLPLLLDVFRQPAMQGKELIVIGSPVSAARLPNVHFNGYQNQPRDYYLAADFLVHPSLYEPYGQVVAESLQCETPVIISAATGASELLSPGEGLVLPELDTGTWLKTLAEINPESFRISPNFAGRNKLTLQEHIRQLLDHSVRRK